MVAKRRRNAAPTADLSTAGGSNALDTDNVTKWSPDQVERWLNEHGFAQFWPFLQPHQPTGIDLLMLQTVRHDDRKF